MKKNIAVIVILLLLLSSCATKDYESSTTAEDDALILSFSNLNETEERTLTLPSKQKINTTIDVFDGSVTIYIKDPEGNIIYQGNGTAVTEFVITVGLAGEYEFLVTGEKASGVLSVMCID